MNFFTRYISTKARQSLLDQNKLFFSFPTAIDADKGVVVLPSYSSVNKIYIKRHTNTIEEISIPPPFYSVGIEITSSDGVLEEMNIAYFEDKSDAEMAKQKIWSAFSKSGIHYTKKLFIFVLFLVLLNQLVYALIGAPIFNSFNVGGSNAEVQTSLAQPNFYPQGQNPALSEGSDQMLEAQKREYEDLQRRILESQKRSAQLGAQSTVPSSPGEDLANALKEKQ